MRYLKPAVLCLVLAGVLCVIGARLFDGPNPCPPGTPPEKCVPLQINR